MTLRESIFQPTHAHPVWQSLHPSVKIILIIWFSLLSILLDNTNALIILAGLSSLLLFGVRLSVKHWKIIGSILLLSVWGTVFSQAIFYEAFPRTRVITLLPKGEWLGFSLPELVIWKEGIFYGLKQSLRFLVMAICGFSVCMSTSPERWMEGFRKIRLPASISFCAMTAIQSLPEIFNQWQQMQRAKKVRGYQTRFCWYRLRSWQVKVAELIHSATNIIAASIRKSQSRSIALSLRGLTLENVGRWSNNSKLSAIEKMLVTLLIVTGILVTITKILYWAYQQEIYYQPEWRTFYEWVRTCL